MFIAVCALLLCTAGDSRQFVFAEPSSSASGAYGAEQRAEELYLDGIEKLEAGHRDFARSTFEQVIADYPSSAAATLARRQLGEIYRAAAQEDGKETAESGRPAISLAPPTSTGSITAPALSDVDGPALQSARSPAWGQELRRNASIQTKLRTEAGDRVFFSAGSAELGTRARTALSAQAQWLMRWHEFEAAIEGHADEPGSEQENVALSAQRAEAVRERLIAEGVEPGRLAVVPLGRSIRIATCADTDCRAQNRRAVTLVFAAGTRGRLGLLPPTMRDPAAEAASAAAFTPANHMELPVTAQRVGVTR